MSDFSNLPPLNALRGFEAVARNLSFSAAAKELRISPAAVSQQIKNLEDFLGVQVFNRQGRRILLTEAGLQMLPGVEKGFRNMADAVQPYLASFSADHLSCSVVGAFAARWLVPRLPSWTTLHPNIDVRISATGEVVEFERMGIDVAIRLGAGDWGELYSELLLPEEVVPLCSPDLLEGEIPLRVPADLGHHQLIHFTPPFGQLNTKWSDWMAIAGVEGIDITRGLFTNDGTMALNAATRGQGVVLAPRVLATEELSSGMLVIPFDHKLPTDLAWYIVIPKPNLKRPEVVAFRDWLISESKELI
jgi:LysR family transcriptional regulator, glycine cleavage system transcriptional activator